jgi:hypothetical protein
MEELCHHVVSAKNVPIRVYTKLSKLISGDRGNDN